MEPKLENLYKLSKERKALRSTLEKESSLPTGDPELIERELFGIEEQIKTWSIAEEGGLTKAKERLRQERAEMESGLWIDETAIAEEIPEYPEISTLLESS